MNRRQFLTGATSVTLSSVLAGCSGVLGNEEEIGDVRQQLNETKSELNASQAKVEELQKDINASEKKIKSTKVDLNSTKQELELKKEELEGAKKRQILLLYAYGITTYNKGIDYYNSGYKRARDNNNYPGARADFNVAGGYFSSAAIDFRAAGSQANEISESNISTYCSDAESKAETMSNAMESYQQAMYYYISGNESTARTKLQSGDSIYSNAQNYEIRDRSTLESECGVALEEDAKVGSSV